MTSGFGHFAARCDPNKTISDYLKLICEPYKEIQRNPEHTETEAEIAEEFSRLVFCIKKTRNMFKTIKMVLAGGGMELAGISDWRAACALEDTPAKSELVNIVEFPAFMWLKSISEIPESTEFIYLGEIDSIELHECLERFGVFFKRFINIIHQI